MGKPKQVSKEVIKSILENYNSIEEAKKEIKRYKKEFGNRASSAYFNHANVLFCNDDIIELFENCGYKTSNYKTEILIKKYKTEIYFAFFKILKMQ